MQPPSPNDISQGQHLASKAVDYRSAPDVNAYATEDAVIQSYEKRGSGTDDAGNTLRFKGAHGVHQFAHLEECYVMPGQQVKRGQKLAKMGYTGYTKPSGPAGRHLHYWVLTPKGYVYPPNLYTQPFQANIGDIMKPTREDIQNMFRGFFNKEPTKTQIDYLEGWKLVDIANYWFKQPSWMERNYKVNNYSQGEFKPLNKQVYIKE